MARSAAVRWNPQQERALKAVEKWRTSNPRQPFILSGYAGTGKTTLAREFASGVGGLVGFAAYTGKAAHVMQQAGCEGALTIHQLIYQPRDKSRKRLVELQRQITEDPDNADLRKALKVEEENLKTPHFILQEDSILRYMDLLVVDECSMVSDHMAKDLLSFGCPILVLGDPAQLPPVKGTGYFTKRKPDAMLTQIHRQAKDNPIIHLATLARNGEDIPYGDYGESRVIRSKDVQPGTTTEAQQVLVGRNRTRHAVNKRLRERFGREGLLCVGDKLVCLRNDHDLGLLNGALFRVADIDRTFNLGGVLAATVEDEFAGRMTYVEMHEGPLRGEDVEGWVKKAAQEFAYGYALTVHKAQGSQWGEVRLVDESYCFKGSRKEWLYTGITRAAERIEIIR